MPAFQREQVAAGKTPISSASSVLSRQRWTRYGSSEVTQVHSMTKKKKKKNPKYSSVHSIQEGDIVCFITQLYLFTEPLFHGASHRMETEFCRNHTGQCAVG